MGNASNEGFNRANTVPGCVMVDNGIALAIFFCFFCQGEASQRCSGVVVVADGVVDLINGPVWAI